MFEKIRNALGTYIMVSIFFGAIQELGRLAANDIEQNKKSGNDIPNQTNDKAYKTIKIATTPPTLVNNGGLSHENYSPS